MSASLQCWCARCRPVTLNDMRMVVCPVCGDKRCVHADDHDAPCAKTDIYAHNAWVQNFHWELRDGTRLSTRSEPDEVLLIRALRHNEELRRRLAELEALERQVKEAETLASYYERRDRRRQWAACGTWLYPGDRVVVLRGEERT